LLCERKKATGGRFQKGNTGKMQRKGATRKKKGGKKVEGLASDDEDLVPLKGRKGVKGTVMLKNREKGEGKKRG